MLIIKLSIYGRKFMVIPQTGHKLSINKVGKNSQILCAHLDPFRWPSHIYIYTVNNGSLTWYS